MTVGSFSGINITSFPQSHTSSLEKHTCSEFLSSGLSLAFLIERATKGNLGKEIHMQVDISGSATEFEKSYLKLYGKYPFDDST